jgi:hypothetical protein
MSQSTQILENIRQNRPDYILDPLDVQPPLFKFRYASKTLEKPQDNPEDYRTVTIKCLMQGCT